MTEWLASWLREIILVVLFAVVTDMLLPNNSMQRYIKVVVSLFILLTILNPILTLVRSGDHLREVDMELNRWSEPTASSAWQMASTAEIEADAEKLRQVGERQTIEWVEERLAKMVKEDLHERGYKQVHAVEAQVEITSSGQADIQEIRVWMNVSADRSTYPDRQDTEASNSTRDGLDDRGRMMEPVQPVVIDIDLGLEQTQPRAQSHGTTRIGSAMTSEIRERIVDQWGVAPEQIVFRQSTR